MTTRRQFLQYSGLTALGLAFPTQALNQLASTNKTWAPYNKAIIIDGLSAAFDHGIDELDDTTIAYIKNSGISALNATIPYPGDDFEAANIKIDNALKVINRYPKTLTLIKQADDIIRAKASDQLGVIIGFQSTEMFGQNLKNITYFAQRGARYMQLSYNGPSQFGSGGLVKQDKGLTVIGRKALATMENNKVLVDLSHSGKQTVADAIKCATRPLTISHTGANAVYQHPRNNDDAELKAVAEKGGVIGVYLMPFLAGGTGEITAEMLMAHIDHCINLCGEDHVSIGSDQGVTPVNDGPEYREAIRKEVEQRIAAGISAPGETPDRPPFIPELNSERRMELIAWHMKKRGYKDSTIEKILGVNLLNLYREVW